MTHCSWVFTVVRIVRSTARHDTEEVSCYNNQQAARERESQNKAFLGVRTSKLLEQDSEEDRSSRIKEEGILWTNMLSSNHARRRMEDGGAVMVQRQNPYEEKIITGNATRGSISGHDHRRSFFRSKKSKKTSWGAFVLIVLCIVYSIQETKRREIYYFSPSSSSSASVGRQTVFSTFWKATSGPAWRSTSFAASTWTDNVSNLTDQNGFVGLWNPSDEWIEACVRYENEQSALVHKRYTVQWPNYRLGDCIRLCKSCEKSLIVSDYKALSMAGEYWNVVCHRTNDYDRSRGSNFTFLEELFQRYEANPHPYTNPWPQPAEDELVIHLRIGDVMDDPIYVGKEASVFQMLRDGAFTRHGLNGEDYPIGIKSIHDYLSLIRESNLTKVVLRGGPHKPKAFPNSRIFTSCLSKAIQAAGYNISSLKVAGEDNPDQDFFYMSHAKYFVPSTGGYSHLIARIVEQRGGRRFYGSYSSNVIQQKF